MGGGQTLTGGSKKGRVGLKGMGVGVEIDGMGKRFEGRAHAGRGTIFLNWGLLIFCGGAERTLG